MGDKSKISWTDATWNPVVGCTKVSEGCKNCYAERDHNKRHKAFQEGKLQNVPQYAKPFNQVQLIDSRLDQPCRWKRPRKIFVNSQSDLFHPDVPFEFIDKVFAIMALSKQHTFQVLTKRPERALEYFKGYEDRIGKELDKLWYDITFYDSTNGDKFNWKPVFPLRNVWFGVTAENQEQADKRIPILLQIPAWIHFVSFEPLLGPIKLKNEWVCRCKLDELPEAEKKPVYGLKEIFERDLLQPVKGIDWVICGGESGSKARLMPRFSLPAGVHNTSSRALDMVPRVILPTPMRPT
jgi:protein gp37